MLDWLFKKREQRAYRRAYANAMRSIQARYDAASDADQSFKNWWSASDGLGARAANSLAVRQKLRERARYEYANNPICKGIIDTRANDTIGTGPRLQLLTENTQANSQVERAWAQWSDACNLASKLRTMFKSLGMDGEPFGLITNNPRLNHPVQIDLRLVECDQFTDPQFSEVERNWCDGIRYDEWGNPLTYRMLDEHPGEQDGWGVPWAFQDIPADQVLHLFREDRPGQCRGIPDITPALTLFASMRHFRDATIAAAETAASLNVIFYTNHLDPVKPDPTWTLNVRTGMIAPDGWDARQVTSEHPSTTYPMFMQWLIIEIARAINMPFSKAAGWTADYTYASGKIEERDYESDLKVDRAWVSSQVVNRLFSEWWREAVSVSVFQSMSGAVGASILIPSELWEMDEPPHV